MYVLNSHFKLIFAHLLDLNILTVKCIETFMYNALTSTIRIIIITSGSACSRYAGCEHFVSALGPSALG